jgi:hypothetical protein
VLTRILSGLRQAAETTEDAERDDQWCAPLRELPNRYSLLDYGYDT